MKYVPILKLNQLPTRVKKIRGKKANILSYISNMPNNIYNASSCNKILFNSNIHLGFNFVHSKRRKAANGVFYVAPVKPFGVGSDVNFYCGDGRLFS